jgi:hypothetical protein
MGPTTICPTAKATRNAVRLSWTAAVETSRSRAIAGSPGMYMSVAKGDTPTIRLRVSNGPRRPVQDVRA